jgi:hypothetical protein
MYMTQGRKAQACTGTLEDVYRKKTISFSKENYIPVTFPDA